MELPTVKCISQCFIKPKHQVEESKHPYHLAPLDLAMLSFHYVQNGLLFHKPSHHNFSISSFLDTLKHSLSQTLVHFYPLAGQFTIQTNQDRHETCIFVDCNKGPGARFSYATLEMTVSDILPQNECIPLVVRSLFDYNEEATNYDGYKKPLLSVQVTELLDGIFIACSINHSVSDGTSYWHFWNVWSEIHRANGNEIPVSHLPIHNRWFPGIDRLPIPLPFTHEDEFIKRFKTPSEIRERIFHFSCESIAKLKAKANSSEMNTTISSFQALSALVWRAMVRANRLSEDQIVHNYMYANNRHRIRPPLPKNYFGTCITGIKTSTTAGELLENSVGWSAKLVHESVVNLSDKYLRDYVKKWVEAPYSYHHVDLHDYNTVAMEHSPRFDMYGNEFGIGKAVGVLSGGGNKAVGVVNAYPAYKGGGSVDLEICLPHHSMEALLNDHEFMSAVSFPKQTF